MRKEINFGQNNHKEKIYFVLNKIINRLLEKMNPCNGYYGNRYILMLMKTDRHLEKKSFQC
jgi:hypothetical protein